MIHSEQQKAKKEERKSSLNTLDPTMQAGIARLHATTPVGGPPLGGPPVGGTFCFQFDLQSRP